MWNIKCGLLLVLMICLLCVPPCIAQTDKVLSGRELLQALRDKDTKDRRSPGGDRKGDTKAITKHPTATELLDRYTRALDSTSSIIED